MDRPLVRYFFISVFVTLLDTLIVYVLTFFVHSPLILANTVGIVTGAIVQYFLTNRHVFSRENDRVSFIIFFGTFLFGILLANGIIYLGNEILLHYFSQKLAFLLAKGLSIGIPFFILYYLRKYLYHKYSQK